MFQKFALAFKTKTIEFFADEAGGGEDGAAHDAEEGITGQRVVVVKPDQPPGQSRLQKLLGLVGSLFATVSAFKAAYHQLQAAHAPLDAAAVEAADRAAVSHLSRLSDLKHCFLSFLQNPNGNIFQGHELPLPSQLEAQVQENQSLLRTFDMAVNRLQAEIDGKDAEASRLKQELKQIEALNSRLEKRLNGSESSSPEFLLTVGLFRSVLLDVCRSAHGFTRLLVEMMKSAGLDLDFAASSLYPGFEYSKAGHNRYAFLSSVCLEMFEGFSSESFGTTAPEGGNFSQKRRNFLLQFVEHGSIDAVELLEQDPDGEFARFCERKCRKLIPLIVGFSSPSSLFGELGGEGLVLDSWRALSIPLYESFVNMASLVWMLHKLAFSFEPPVRIFQVERGAEFSMVYMESVTAQRTLMADYGAKVEGKVGFCVFPGFRVGKTVIQSQVYLNGLNREPDVQNAKR